MKNRLEELEKRTDSGIKHPVAWIICHSGETQDAAIERYETKNGPIGDCFKIIWTGVPRGGGPMRLKGRIDALEKRCLDDLKPWHQVIQRVGQTEEEAMAQFEAEHGPIGDDNCIIIRIVAPAGGSRPCSAASRTSAASLPVTTSSPATSYPP